MKVLLVNGSPHPEGCTYTALKEVEKNLNEHDISTQIYWIGNKPISGCLACGKCRTLGKCVIDDTVNEFANLVKSADGFIFGSPVYYASASGQLISFLDRLFFSTPKNFFYLKPGAAIVSARRAGTSSSLDEINKYFTISEMPIVSSRYWNEVHGMTKEEVLQDKEGMYTMRVLGRNFAYLLKCLDLAKTNGVPLPKKEDPIYTNFIQKQ